VNASVGVFATKLSTSASALFVLANTFLALSCSCHFPVKRKLTLQHMHTLRFVACEPSLSTDTAPAVYKRSVDIWPGQAENIPQVVMSSKGFV
jgi:hypothetical protein